MKYYELVKEIKKYLFLQNLYSIYLYYHIINTHQFTKIRKNIINFLKRKKEN